ncbi:MAG: hypothetical protein ABI658_23160 [Acidimicrobiales bacterium]
MLGRNKYTREELDQSKATIGAQLAAYKAVIRTTGGKAADKKVAAALEAFEPLFFNNLTIALDRFFVHRVRPVTGKDGNPLNEVEMICESLLNNNGVLRESKVIKLIPEKSVTKLQFGESIRLTGEQFERLSDAFFTELERKFL